MLGNFSLFFWLCFGAASVWRSARGMESARGLWRCGGWADPRKRLRGRPVPRETARRVARGASTFGGEMGIFSAGSGGLFVAAAGSLELRSEERRVGKEGGYRLWRELDRFTDL